ncbi:LysM peptidoglycan-binding domain-containing protein [Flavobacterium orientale]|uniref:Lytic transglycosylase n=1 Tax=Flavobacterium orientale TaxID=1756020 RepID=A0A916XYZ7_9FLAO|nr:LysM peptidoglycan-binding domain-containing protein [Flavobacterium orientale]GGD22127.1 lytic transglycosylase [Flavobacterium orientale]
MKLQNTTLVFLLLLSGQLFAQDSLATANQLVELPKISFLDSIKKSFVHHEIAACVDERFVSEIASLELYKEITNDIENIDLEVKVDYELSTDLLKERLKELDAKSAFNIEYNPGLENIIKHYLKNRKKSYERLMGLSQYYFPIFEASLAKYNVPLEIKYLAIVESALNPRAVSKMGATGLWQFMYGTGKQYNLEINTFVDERSDVLKATEAACQYMVNMYAIFGDWDLVLASYNAGPGNVTKAIRRSGGKQNYWNIRPFLPKETQGYVPAFLATMYVYEYHKEHGIVPNKPILNTFSTDTIKIKNKMSFKQISDLLDISVEQLQFLNPSYKRDYVPFISGKDHYLRLPIDKVAVFTSNEEKIYAYTEHDFSKREKPFSSQEALAAANGNFEVVSRTKYHTVKRGETLGGISKKYGVTLTNVKQWNNLKSNNIGLGKKLKIISNERIASSPVKKVNEPTTVKSIEVEKNTVVVSKDSTVKKIHQVEKGETLSQLSKKYNSSIEELKKWNNLKDSNIALGSKLIVANEVITDEDNLNLHIVKAGESLHSIAKAHNISTDDLIKWNDLEDANVIAGLELKIIQSEEVENSVTEIKAAPKKASKTNSYKNENVYIVKKGDSLFSISQKIPGVTVADLKKWNGISGGSVIKPGMKLKING